MSSISKLVRANIKKQLKKQEDEYFDNLPELNINAPMPECKPPKEDRPSLDIVSVAKSEEIPRNAVACSAYACYSMTTRNMIVSSLSLPGKEEVFFCLAVCDECWEKMGGSV